MWLIRTKFEKSEKRFRWPEANGRSIREDCCRGVLGLDPGEDLVPAGICPGSPAVVDPTERAHLTRDDTRSPGTSRKTPGSPTRTGIDGEHCDEAFILTHACARMVPDPDSEIVIPTLKLGSQL